MNTVWYRVVDGRTASSLDEWERPCGDSRAYVYTHEHPVIRETPKGVWLDVYGSERFVRRDARKRWACPTKEEAIESFRARKARQAKILRAKLRHVDEVLAMVQREAAA